MRLYIRSLEVISEALHVLRHCSNDQTSSPTVNTSPIKCPFKGPYSFSYSKGINECKDPLSEIDECTDDKRLLLKFKACADIPGSESRGKIIINFSLQPTCI